MNDSSTMTVTVLLFAQARERTGRSKLEVELPHGSRLSDLLDATERLHPALAELRPHLAVAVDRRLVAADEELKRGAEIALLPPVSGG